MRANVPPGKHHPRTDGATTLSRKRPTTGEIGRHTTIRSRQEPVNAPPPTSRLRSPIVVAAFVILAVVVVAIGVIAVAALPKSSGAAAPAGPGSTTAAGILVPASGTSTALAGSRTLGLPTAPVGLIVWSDFQCQACRLFATTILPQVIRDYVDTGKVAIAWRDHAIVGPESVAAATAARCADQQGRFWQYHDVLFANQGTANSGTLNPQRLKDMADAVGLDRAKFDACLPGADLFNQVTAETKQGDARGGDPPTLDFGTEVISGSPPYPELKAKLDALVAAANAAPGPASVEPTETVVPSGS